MTALTANSVSPATASREGGRLAFITQADDEPAHGIQRIFAFAERGKTPYAILTLVCALLFGLGLATLPPTDRDEARFMQATKQMIETGDYVTIKVQDDPRTKKPIGIYWLQAASVHAFGQPLSTAWPYRIPSALGAWLAVLMTCFAGRRLFGARAGLVAGLAMATLPLTVAEAHLAKTDAMLLGLTTLAMAMLGAVYLNRKLETNDGGDTRRLIVFWLAGGAAALIKGPVILLVVGATVSSPDVRVFLSVFRNAAIVTDAGTYVDVCGVGLACPINSYSLIALFCISYKIQIVYSNTNSCFAKKIASVVCKCPPFFLFATRLRKKKHYGGLR